MLSILSIPSLIFYFSGNKSGDYSIKSLVSQFSVGNIGATNLACNNGFYNVTQSNEATTGSTSTSGNSVSDY